MALVSNNDRLCLISLLENRPDLLHVWLYTPPEAAWPTGLHGDMLDKLPTSVICGKCCIKNLNLFLQVAVLHTIQFSCVIVTDSTDLHHYHHIDFFMAQLNQRIAASYNN